MAAPLPNAEALSSPVGPKEEEPQDGATPPSQLIESSFPKSILEKYKIPLHLPPTARGNVWVFLLQRSPATRIDREDLRAFVNTVEFVYGARHVELVSKGACGYSRQYKCKSCNWSITFKRPRKDPQSGWKLPDTISSHEELCPTTRTIPNWTVLFNHPLVLEWISRRHQRGESLSKADFCEYLKVNGLEFQVNDSNYYITIRKLIASGVNYEPKYHHLSAIWEQNYAALKKFHDYHGHVRVPTHHKKLFQWLQAQIYRHKVSTDENYLNKDDQPANMYLAIEAQRTPLSSQEHEKLVALGVNFDSSSSDQSEQSCPEGTVTAPSAKRIRLDDRGGSSASEEVTNANPYDVEEKEEETVADLKNDGSDLSSSIVFEKDNLLERAQERKEEPSSDHESVDKEGSDEIPDNTSESDCESWI